MVQRFEHLLPLHWARLPSLIGELRSPATLCGSKQTEPKIPLGILAFVGIEFGEMNHSEMA